MNIVAFILAVIAAVIFAMGDPFWQRYRRGSVAVGLFFLTVALIIQFCTVTRQVHF